jgi:ketosteroid isomerase-like protein
MNQVNNTVKRTANNANDELSAIDALYRFAQGLDTDDAAVLSSAFAEDAIADFSPAAAKLGIPFPLLSGQDNIVGALIGFVAPLTTSHSVANPRVAISGDSASMSALVEAQHFPAKDHTRHLLMKNRYQVELVRSGSQWLIQRVVIENIWWQGDVSVITGG